MSFEQRLARLERRRPPAATAPHPLTDAEWAAHLAAMLARLGEGEEVPSSPPPGVVPLTRAVARSFAAGSAPPGRGRIGDHLSPATADLLLAVVERACGAAALGCWPELDGMEG